MVAVHNLWPTATAVATTGAITSEAVSTLFNRGFCNILIEVAGSSPEVDVTFTVSRGKGQTYYSPVDGAGTSLGDVYSALTASAWVHFSPVIAPFMKITITGTVGNGADTTVKAWLMFPEETEAM